VSRFFPKAPEGRSGAPKGVGAGKKNRQEGCVKFFLQPPPRTRHGAAGGRQKRDAVHGTRRPSRYCAAHRDTLCAPTSGQAQRSCRRAAAPSPRPTARKQAFSITAGSCRSSPHVAEVGPRRNAGPAALWFIQRTPGLNQRECPGPHRPTRRRAATALEFGGGWILRRTCPGGARSSAALQLFFPRGRAAQRSRISSTAAVGGLRRINSGVQSPLR